MKQLVDGIFLDDDGSESAHEASVVNDAAFQHRGLTLKQERTVGLQRSSTGCCSWENDDDIDSSLHACTLECAQPASVRTARRAASNDVSCPCPMIPGEIPDRSCDFTLRMLHSDESVCVSSDVCMIDAGAWDYPLCSSHIMQRILMLDEMEVASLDNDSLTMQQQCAVFGGVSQLQSSCRDIVALPAENAVLQAAGLITSLDFPLSQAEKTQRLLSLSGERVARAECRRRMWAQALRASFKLLSERIDKLTAGY